MILGDHCSENFVKFFLKVNRLIIHVMIRHTIRTCTAISFIHHITTLTAMFLDQPNILNAHGFLGGFCHIINGQGGNRDRSQRFHFDAGFANRFCSGSDDHPGKGVIQTRSTSTLVSGSG